MEICSVVHPLILDVFLSCDLLLRSMFVIEMIFESFGSFPLLLRAILGGVFVRLPTEVR